MSNLFSNQGVEVKTGGGSNQKYIYGGVYHNVTIEKIVGSTNQNGKPMITVTMFTAEGTAENSKDFNFYFSTEKAAEISKTKLKHMLSMVNKEALFDAVVANSIEEYGAALNTIGAGRALRMKFSAEQYEWDGKVRDKAVIGFPVFAEAIMQGAEYAPVTDENTALTFDKDNEWDYKKLEGVEPTSEAEVAAPATAPTTWNANAQAPAPEGSDDLPF